MHMHIYAHSGGVFRTPPLDRPDPAFLGIVQSNMPFGLWYSYPCPCPRRSSTNFIPYPVVLRACSAKSLGHGHGPGYEGSQTLSAGARRRRVRGSGRPQAGFKTRKESPVVAESRPKGHGPAYADRTLNQTYPRYGERK